MIGAVVLAAGAATRFGAPKQALLLPAVLERLRAVDPVVVVSGAYELEGAEAAVVVLADGPSLAPEAVERVIREWRLGDDPIVAASYGGARGHPLVLGREAWAVVPDEGLRALPARLVPCDDLGAPGDVDRPEDLPERFRRKPGEPM
jgi:CTP:molybdopterin cytidylyltransferase MocA